MKNKTTLVLLGAVALATAAIILAWPDPPRSKPSQATLAAPPAAELRTPAEIAELAGFDPPAPPTPEEIAAADVMTIEVADPDFALPALPLQAGELPWETSIRSIAEAPGQDDAQIGRRLLEVLPNLPVQGRETAAEEAIRRIPNAQYDLAVPAITNPNTYGLALTAMFADLMERPEAIRLPTLLKIARTPQHPLAPNARENLDSLLGDDFGTDWIRWDAAIKASLAKGK